MLATETITIEDALAELGERIDEYQAKMERLDEETAADETLPDMYDTAQSRQDRLRYLQNGLQWQRDEEGWGDATVELGALTAGEKAMMHRTASDTAGQEEMRLWFVAASTVDAPYAGDDLEATFQNLSSCHPGFAEWVESKANALGVPAESGNRSSTSSTATETSGTSTTEPDSTTSSSSDSPTA
jgi:hypothetical protein